ncbi:MAG: ABC transporter permease, partial [Candidatus Bipolaricaulis sp.]
MLQRLKTLRRYPSAIIGIAVLAMLVAVSIYAVIAIPYGEAIRLWRGGPGVWDDNPRNAAPVWFDWFTGDKLPRTIIVSTADAGVKRVEPIGGGKNRVEITLPFTYNYDRFPSELILNSEAVSEGTARTRFSVFWRTAAGEMIPLATNRAMRATDNYYISQDLNVSSQLPAGTVRPEVGLFSDYAVSAP